MMESGFLESKERKSLGKFLKKKGVKVCEAPYSLLQLSQEVEKDNYQILYSAEFEGSYQPLSSIVIAWPKAKGNPSKKVEKVAKVYGRDHVFAVKASQFPNNWKSLNKKFMFLKRTV